MLLAEIRDRLGEAIRGIAAIGKAKTSRDRPFPRPRTELDRARDRAEQRAYLEGLAVFSPHALTNN
ncbi:hypothetical protein [Georgenia wangjunii]|uniref:hypothetical protein n=1 Tax=Georgenia wangjunii TaxID=3117730 RepID=UPI002F269926